MQGSSNFFLLFIKLAGPYWNSEEKIAITKRLVALIVLTLMQIGLAVVINQWNADLFNALEQRSMSGLLKQIGIIILIFFASMAVTSTHLAVKRQLQIGWRAWLTDRVTGKWMNNGRQYLVTHIKTGDHDNPDGRIAEDIRIAVDDSIALSHSLFYSSLMLISFTAILWNLSGTVMLNLGFTEIPIYGHLVWIAIMYAAAASILGWWIGQPLNRTTNIRQTKEANFRFALVNARENSQAIALIQGETNERNRLLALFRDLIDTYDRQTDAWKQILLFTSGYSVLSMAFPILISSPRFVLGTITLGALMQSAQAFQHMASSLSWPVNNLAGIATWRASVERVLGLVKALDDLEEEIQRPDPRRIQLEKTDRSSICFRALRISKLNGEILLDGLNAEIGPSERVLIAGHAPTGAKLFKAIAGLWPWGGGRIELPDEEPMFFMPPRPYLPRGTLRAAICYPSAGDRFDQGEMEKALKQAGVADLIELLDQDDNWDKSLTREQQQRLGLARLLLYKPKWILLQEAFDSLDPDGETAMLRLIAEQLPGAALLSITNQPTAVAFHERRIVMPAPENHKAG
ncbi:MAG: ABC transporter ATP-binding protein/permease [Gammaproteobacteria bacterium]